MNTYNTLWATYKSAKINTTYSHKITCVNGLCKGVPSFTNVNGGVAKRTIRTNAAILLATLLTVYSVIDSEWSKYPRVAGRFVSLFNKNVS